MRILFDTDLEGATGVYNMEMCFRGDCLFEFAYKELAEDINAAADGAFAGGANEVIVLDGHGELGLDFSQLDSRVICGNSESLNSGFDAMFCIGYHAMAGTWNAFLDHTQSSKTWFEYRINGRPCGEIAQSAIQAAHYNAPVILVTGDEAAVTEAHAFLGEIEEVTVKRSIGRNSCRLYNSAETRKKIREAAMTAVNNLCIGSKSYMLYKPTLPMEILLTYTRSDYADVAVMKNPRLERLDSRTIRKIAESYLDIMP